MDDAHVGFDAFDTEIVVPVVEEEPSNWTRQSLVADIHTMMKEQNAFLRKQQKLLREIQDKLEVTAKQVNDIYYAPPHGPAFIMAQKQWSDVCSKE